MNGFPHLINDCATAANLTEWQKSLPHKDFLSENTIPKWQIDSSNPIAPVCFIVNSKEVIEKASLFPPFACNLHLVPGAIFSTESKNHIQSKNIQTIAICV